MNPLTTETLTILGAVAAASFGGAFWLSSQLRRLEKIFYKELGAHRQAIDDVVADLQRRVYRLELKEFGFTQTGVSDLARKSSSPFEDRA